MSGKRRKDLRHSKQTSDQSSHSISAHASRRSTPDPYYRSQPTVDPRFNDQSVAGLRSSGQSDPDQRRITGPYRGQRSNVPQPTPYPSFSSQATLHRQPITDPYGHPILEATTGGSPSLHFSSQPTVNPRFSDPPITDTRFSGQSTSYQQHFTNPYGDQRFPVPQHTAYPSFGVEATPNQQPITDPDWGQSILEATPGGHPGPYFSSQPTVNPRFSDQSITDTRFSGQSTSYQQRFTDPYRVQRFPIPQPNPYPSFSAQPTSYQQRITDPYGGQTILKATSSGHPVAPSGVQAITNGIYTITNVRYSRFIYLEDPNDATPVRGHFRPVNRNAQWQVRSCGNEEYTIQNVEHNRYAYCGPLAKVNASVEGYSTEQLWRIQALPTGEYTIATTDTRNFWMLPYGDPGTPVELFNVHTDRGCWWSLKRLEIEGPENENAMTTPTLFDWAPPIAPSGGQSIPEDAVTRFYSIITEATYLLEPLKAACGALKIVLQRAESIGHISGDQTALIKILQFHLATVENHVCRLEEDQRIDETIPVLNQDVRETLETYARALVEIYKLLFDNQPESSSFGHDKGMIAEKTLKIDEAFQIYTTALHRFAAHTVAQMQQQLAQFRQEFQQDSYSTAEKARLNRPNAYGIQHCECLQGTREKTIAAISDWVGDTNTEKWILFFLDVAGSGKSTVAKHMAEKWTRENQLLARFFFSRDTAETMSTNSFCSTLAGAFADLDENYISHMSKFTARPNTELLSFKERFEGLVAGPLRAIGRRAILIIDALDECEAKLRDELLRTLLDLHDSIPLLRILATGRPERDIKRWAEEKYGFGYTNFTQLEGSDRDVKLYIEYTLRELPDIQDRLHRVIRRAEGLFIWARIACDLLLDSDDVDSLLEELGKEVSLDYLYKVALKQSMPREGASRRAMVLVLQMILAAKEPLSIAELEVLSPKRGVVEKVVTRLSSVLLYQGREDPIRLLHATFREFLIARSKADIFFIQPEIGHHTLASGCLTIISDRSKQDDDTLRGLDAISDRQEPSFAHDNY